MNASRISRIFFIVLLLLFKGSIFSQIVERSFEGVQWSDKRPPDPEMAVGPNHVVLIVNSKIAVYSKDGTQLSNNNLSTFFNSVTPPGDPFDPRVVYDHLSSRWVVYALSKSTGFTTSNYLIAVSQNTDPTSQWYYYKFDARFDNTTNTSNWADYTGLGYDSEAVYITSNQKYIYGSQDFQYAKIRAIKKSDLYSGVSTPAFKDFTNMIDVQGGTKKSENIQPVHQFGTASKFYLMNTANDITANYVVVWSITNPFGTSSVTREANINVGQYNPPLPVVQKNSSNTLDPCDAKISDCVFKNGYLYGCFTIKNSTNNGNAIKYIKVNTSDFSLVINDVIEAQNMYYFFPEMYPDLNDNVVLVFNKASANDYAGVAWTYRYSNASTIGGINWLKEGEAAYYNLVIDRNRWGDYSGICLDPSDNRKVWVYGEYAKTSTTWSTWVGMINMTLNIPIQFSNLVSTQNAGGSLTVNSSTSVTSGQSLSVLQGDNTVKTNNERFVNWNSSGLTYKHNNWNSVTAEKFLSHGFTASPGSGQQQNALFRDMQYAKVELKLDNVSPASGGTLEFQDPWYVLSSGSQPGNYWLSFTSFYEPTGKEGATEKGVFLGQPIVAGQPYYSARAQATQTINGYAAYFQNWSAANATMQSTTALETPVVFTNANAIVTSNYKGHLISSSSAGFTTNSQRKIVKTTDNQLHLVYESMGKVWYTRSTDNGVSWTQEVPVNYLGYDSKNCSISSYGTSVYIIYQSNESSYPCIRLDKYIGGARSWSYVAYTLSSYTYETKPVVASYENTICVVYKPTSSSALYAVKFQADGTKGTNYQIINTDANSQNPTIVTTNQHFAIAYQNSTTEIRYEELSVDLNSTLVFDYQNISSGSPYTNNIEPSISAFGSGPIVSWSGYNTGIPTAVTKRRVSGTWSGFNSFGSGTVRNTNNNSISNGDEGSIISWCDIYNAHKFVKLTNGSFSSILTLPESGGNGQIQIGNGSGFADLKAVVYKSPTSSIYPVQSLSYNFQTLQKISNDGYMNYGRTAVIQKDKKNYVYYLGGVTVDKNKVKFRDYIDTLVVQNEKEMDERMATETFHLAKGSALEFKNLAYAFDGETFKQVKSNNVSFTIELAKQTNNEKKNELAVSNFDVGEVIDDESAYKVSFSNIEEGDYYLIVKSKTNGDAKFYINDVAYENPVELKKEQSQEITIDLAGVSESYLDECYPNPFNPTTQISFTLKETGKVSLKVYDVLGKEVANLADGNYEAGKHVATFNGSNLASGIYFYRLVTTNATITKKMMLMK
ncbi:MAG: T9SS C-terminal target domain-containing protein [Stygiobacter sp.]|nr:MAG: T9SS C-terminal target domain-containing protein [Stygiobacter sp.]